MKKLEPTESDRISELSLEVRSMNDPLERVKRILEEVVNKGMVNAKYFNNDVNISQLLTPINEIKSKNDIE